MTTISKLLSRPLGKNGPVVPRLGIGLMNLSGAYAVQLPDEQRLEFLDAVYKSGETFWDTGELSLANPISPCAAND